MANVRIDRLEPGLTIKVHEGPFSPNYGTIEDCTANIPDDAFDWIEQELAGEETEGTYTSDNGEVYKFEVVEEEP